MATANPMTDEDEARMRWEHAEFWDREGAWCSYCEEDWPCRGSRTLASIDQLRGAIEWIMVWLDKLSVDYYAWDDRIFDLLSMLLGEETDDA